MHLQQIPLHQRHQPCSLRHTAAPSYVYQVAPLSPSGAWGATGSAKGSACLATALRCLSGAVVTALADNKAATFLSLKDLSAEREGGIISSALDQLRELSLATSSKGILKEESKPPSATPVGPINGQREGDSSGSGRLRVTRDSAWLVESGARVSGMMAKVLPPLCSHPSASVREAVAAAATRMLRVCGRGGGALGEPGVRVLTEAVLTLAQDEYHQVGLCTLP